MEDLLDQLKEQLAELGFDFLLLCENVNVLKGEDNIKDAIHSIRNIRMILQGTLTI